MRLLQKLYLGFAPVKGLFLLAVLLLYGVALCAAGGSLAGFAIFLACVAGYLVLPGWLLTRLLFRRQACAGGLRLPLTVLLGTAALVLTHAAAMLCGQPLALHALPVLSLAAALLCLRRGGVPRPARPRPHHWALLVLYALLLLGFTLMSVSPTGLPGRAGAIAPVQDMCWNAGNTASFKLAFPPADLRVQGISLHYHFLTEWVAGALALAGGGLPAYQVRVLYFQPVLLAALVPCLYALGRQIWRGQRRVKPLLFCAALPLLGGIHPSHLFANTNNQGTGTLFLCVFLALLCVAARQKYRLAPQWAGSLLLAMLLLSLAKGPVAALAALALLCSMAVCLLQKRLGARGLAVGLALLGCFAAVYALLYHPAASTTMRINPAASLQTGLLDIPVTWLLENRPALFYVLLPLFAVLHLALLLPALLPLYGYSIAADLRRFGTLGQPRLLCQAGACGGFLAYFLFANQHTNQVYFLCTAAFFATLLAVDGIDLLPGLWRRALQRRHYGKAMAACLALLACLLLGLAQFGLVAAAQARSGARHLAANLGLATRTAGAGAVLPQEEEALLWLRANTPANAVFATNHVHAGNRTGLSCFYTAVAERQAFEEGYVYTMYNAGLPMEWVLERSNINNRIISVHTPEAEVLALCRRYGIGYILYSQTDDGLLQTLRQRGGHLSGMEIVFENEMTRIYKVPQ